MRLPRLNLAPHRPGNVVETWSGWLGDELYPRWAPGFDELAEVRCVVERDANMGPADVATALDVHWSKERMGT